jgi:plasmid replication initiation protein
MTKKQEEKYYKDVVKSNELVQKARYNLSFQSQKILLYLISRIKNLEPNQDGEFRTEEFKIDEFCEFCGINKEGENYANVKRAVKELSDCSDWITLYDKDGEVYETLVRWIEKPLIYKRKGTILLKLDKDLAPFLLKLSESFTRYKLENIFAMQSKYSIRLYELLKSYQNQGRAVVLEVDTLKNLLFAEQYKLFADFKRRVIDMALAEIEKFTDITVSYKTLKTGKKVTSLEFTIKLKRVTKEDATPGLTVLKARDERMASRKQRQPTRGRTKLTTKTKGSGVNENN